ncbi:MAG TPA: glycoside hydrolase family 3 N-terminal domain-containing protein [Chlamydiales bacterium]|nr:glycoside hydrolase family 3 N-terminal domain-containing protein [Chlamydiales bacterium]
MRKFLPFFLLPTLLFAGWAEDTLHSMTFEEKVGQLFVAPACPKRGEDHWADWLKLMKDCHVGNALVKHADPVTQVQFLNRLQDEAKIPLLITSDMEWGLAMRMANTMAFPKNMTLGAVRDVEKIRALGREMGRQAKRVGVHLNLAPVADVNCNPENPVIHMRSFGDDPEEVGRRVSAFLQGVQESGVLACAKHFPGHGDTNVDSHHDLPWIPFSMQRLEQIELLPFQKAIEAGVAGLMIAHLQVSCIDPVYPSSLSVNCIELAREKLHFEGLIISDALNMKAVAERYSPEEVACLARGAGCDLLLYGADKDDKVDQLMREQIPRAYRALVEKYRFGDVEELDAAVLRILQAKESLGLHLERKVALGNLLQALHTREGAALKKELFREAVTWVGEPVLLEKNVAYVSIGGGDVLAQEFAHSFTAPFDHSKFDQVVVAIHQANGLEEWAPFLNEIAGKSIVCLFATPYVLPKLQLHRSILVGYENDPDAQWAVYHAMEGKEEAIGKLPVDLRSLSKLR